MNDLNKLLAAIRAQTIAQQEQTAAINRLAESNESLCAVIIQSLVDDEVIEQQEPVTYLSGRSGR
nr:hypothetical protein [Entomohabitans teleogrylli]